MCKLRIMPHVEQIKGPNDWSCGAASLAMLYKYYGIPETHDSIWNDVCMQSLINPRERICQTIKIAKNCEKHNLRTTIFSVANVQEIFQFCQDNHLELIFMYRQTRDAQTGHFVLLSNVDGNYIYVNDPYLSDTDGVNVKMTISDIQPLMESPNSGGRILGNNLLISIGPPNIRTRVKSISCPNCRVDSYVILPILARADKIMCPECGMLYINSYKESWYNNY